MNLPLTCGKSKTQADSSSQKRKPLQWFRFYAEAVDDPKVQRLPPHLFKTWINLLCIASQSGGTLPSLDDLAFRLRMSSHDAEQQISDLILAGLIDITEAGRSPHNWSGRQFQSDCSTERVKKHRRNKAATLCNVSETASETPPEQSRAETEQKQTVCADEIPPDGQPGWQNLKLALNGSTEAMIADVQRFMGPVSRRADAVNWLTGTVSAFGSSRTAQAWTIVTAKMAKGELVPNPLPLWSRTAKGLRADDAQSPMPAFKSFRQMESDEASARKRKLIETSRRIAEERDREIAHGRA